MQYYILGGYTKDINKGISLTVFDPENLSLGDATPIAQLNNPTWITLSKNKNRFFVIDKQVKGGIVIFDQIESGLFVRKTDCYATKGAGCHITIHEFTQSIYVSNYHEGTIDIYQVDENDTMELLNRHHHLGKSVHPNQQSSHIHMTMINEKFNQVYACDLGTDKIHIYDILENGDLKWQGELVFPAGTGPRHLTFHPTLDVLYVVGELNNTTSIVKINPDKTLTFIDSKLNVDKEKSETSAGAAIRISNDGKFLYVSTRFHNVITVFQIDEVGMIQRIQEASTLGEIPRDFILDESEKFLLIPHQGTHKITIFSRDQKTGLIHSLPVTAFAPECVNIVKL